MESSILTLGKIYLNGGKRGFLVGIDPKNVEQLLQPTLVAVGVTKG
jgi:prolyl-tRNA editing enzyme YbaK/EbsC (Cys-tRNA(Pro) deacylase)